MGEAALEQACLLLLVNVFCKPCRCRQMHVDSHIRILLFHNAHTMGLTKQTHVLSNCSLSPYTKLTLCSLQTQHAHSHAPNPNQNKSIAFSSAFLHLLLSSSSWHFKNELTILDSLTLQIDG